MAVLRGFGNSSLNTSGIADPSIKTFDQLANWNAATVTNSGGIVRATVTGYDGLIYAESLSYNTLTGILNTVTYSVSGQTIGIISELNKSLSSFQLYEGAALIEYLLDGNDTISGGDGNDILYGFAGNDTINGGGGNDFIMGGTGFDAIYGGSGIDTAMYGLDKLDYLISKNPTNGSYAVFFKGSGVEYVHWDVEKFQFRDQTIDATSLKYYGTTTNEVVGSKSSVFRFFNTKDSAFFYTNSISERDAVLANSDPSHENINEWPYVYQGTTFESAHTYPGSIPLARFYNTDTGHHFFTASSAEADAIRAKIATHEWAFIYEGLTFGVYASDPNPTSRGQEMPVERFYSPTLNRHWFTANPEEITQIRLTGVWNDEGVGFWGEAPGP